MNTLNNISLSALMKFLEVDPLVGEAAVKARASLAVSESAVIYTIDLDEGEGFLADEAGYHVSSFTLEISDKLNLDVDWDHDLSRAPHFILTFYGDDEPAYQKVMSELNSLLAH